MNTRAHFQNACFITGGLLVLVILSKILNDSPQNSNTQSGVELLNQAIKWRKIAHQDSQPFMKLQHLVFSSAYISAARQIAKESELEKITGADLSKLKKILEHQIQSTTDTLNSKCPKLRGKMYSLTF